MIDERKISYGLMTVDVVDVVVVAMVQDINYIRFCNIAVRTSIVIMSILL